MTSEPRGRHPAVKILIFAAVGTAGFLSGWSAMSLTAGLVFAIALGAAVAAPVFGCHHSTRPPRHPGH